MQKLVSGLCVLFCWSVCLPLGQHHTGFLQRCPQSGSVSPPAVLLFSEIVVAVWSSECLGGVGGPRPTGFCSCAPSTARSLWTSRPCGSCLSGFRLSRAVGAVGGREVFLLGLRVLGPQAEPWWSVLAKAPHKACEGEVSVLLKEEGGERQLVADGDETFPL